tara:strand:+ start:220 stop:429 length:210 start_codon:yes stop_codon:yes gene_type:complete
MKKKEFLGIDSDSWNFILKWNIGLVVVYVFFSISSNQGMSDKDTLLYFFMFNAPLWTLLLYVIYSKFKK